MSKSYSLRSTRKTKTKTTEEEDEEIMTKKVTTKTSKRQKKVATTNEVEDDDDSSKMIIEKPITKTRAKRGQKRITSNEDDSNSIVERPTKKKTRATRNQKKKKKAAVSEEEDDYSKSDEKPTKRTKTRRSTEFKENQENSKAETTASSSAATDESTLVKQSRLDAAVDENTTESSESGNGFSIEIMRKIFFASNFVQKQNECVQSMYKLIKEVKFEVFYEEFCRNVKISLQYEHDNPKVKSILDMIATFTISIKNENLLKNKLNEDTFDEIGLELFGRDTFLIATISKTYKNLLDHILDDALIPFLNSMNVSTRLNTLYLVHKIIEHCADIEINIYNRLKTALLSRIQDKNPNVRVNASHALRRFQAVDDPMDSVVDALLFHLKYDNAPTVRLACLNNIQLSKHNQSDIISKTRDVSSKIRHIAFKKISRRVDFKGDLTMDQRLTLLNNGFKDRNEVVRQAVRTYLVPGWIKSYDDDIIQLLNDLDVIVNVDVVSKFLEVVFQYAFSIKIEKRTRLHLIVDKFYEEYLDDRSILNEKQQSPETCLFWRCLGSFLKRNEDELMKYQPDLESKLNLRKEINSLLEAIDDLDVGDRPVNSTNSNEDQSKNIVNEEENDNGSQSTGEQANLNEEEQSMIDQNVENEESISKANPIDLIIPSISNFVSFFKNFCIEVNEGDYERDDLINFEFIFKELCLFLDNYEIADDSQKNLVVNLAEDILLMDELGDKFDDYIDHLMKFISKSVFKTHEEISNYTIDITNKIEESLEHKDLEEDLPVIDPEEIRKLELTFARETVNLHDLKDKLDEALVRREYDCAHDYKQQIEIVEEKMSNIKHEIHKMQNISIRQRSEPEIDIQVQDHPSVHLKLLQVFGSFLRYGKCTNLKAMMNTRVQTYILPGIVSTDSKIRYYALNSLNHACFLSSTLSMRYTALYHEICTKDSENLQITALRGLIDSLIEHGLYILYPDDDTVNQQSNEPRSILDIQPLEEDDEEMQQQNTRRSTLNQFTKESSFLLNKSEITTPNISMCEDEEDGERNRMYHNTNNESDLDRETENDEDDEYNEQQANLTMKSQIIDQNRTANKTQLQIDREEEIIKQLTKFLLKFIRSGGEEVKSTSVLAICKLLLLGKIYSPLLLSELILLWYNSSTSISIQHDIGTFLPIYCQSSTLYNIDIPENFNGQHCLFECFMSTVENVYRLERGQQLNTSLTNVDHSNYYDSEIDVLNVIGFMLHLLEPSNHAKISIEVCEKILEILKIERDDEYELKEPYITKYLIRSLDSFNLYEISEDDKLHLKLTLESIMKEKRYEKLKKMFITKIEKFNRKVNP